MEKEKKNKRQSDKEPVLRIKDLHKGFGDLKILNGFNLELYEGENLVIMGKSGSGKSVMIKCLVGLMAPDKGSVEVLGKDINSLERPEMDHLRANIGFLFQGSALYDSMTVRENLEFPLRHHTRSLKEKDVEALVIEALKNVGLEHTLENRPAELSGGMQRRIALARALILKPKIILYDEPTTGLDPITAKEIIHLMMEIQTKYQTSSLIITHDVDCARVISNRMILLLEGINYAEGTFQELSTMEDTKVKAFFK
ncbi:ATP-binding cassette domain-containing protein [Antarcticibacterium flavum]|uniref:ATP-binding cassette domain-containing protein n=1 Tax=Antarcticibacterium flavum TaxID=2058175 RepID=A0A5B7WZZ8_9FLAO|nr:MULTISPECIES: ATP-binding cassette domain-containing protein [Antarcticibacterium]MCM4158702.1 ABC transporter ATP-binding protein [Antarcticibacterium sp. W02-3]QCY68555.1 ATP-binding cassette domain-containing protein [Antarcticibacterium flavum]